MSLQSTGPIDTPEKIQELVERFRRNRHAYRHPSYGETEVRREFVDPLFKTLGWDIDNEKGYAEPYKDVVHEASVRVEGAPKAPDYSFRIGGTRRFFVETKKPAANLKENPAPAFQLRRYGWSAKLPLSILTDFEELAVYDCRVQPYEGDKASTARVLYLTCEEYLPRWNEIAAIFARESVLKGSFDRYAASTKDKRGTAQVDEVFLEEIESWREILAHDIARQNPALSRLELTAAVQRTMDRIVFLRICEDRGIESYGKLRAASKNADIYSNLVDRFHHADQRYNSGLFHFRKEPGREEPPDTFTLDLAISDKPLREIIEGLYYPKSPYEFSVLSAEILGQVYERFLGSTIRLTPSHRAKVEPKPEVRKAGGVYYTPTFIVKYIVEHTLAPKLNKRRPDDVVKLRLLDPACGSGHFLVHAYQYLLNWHLQWYVDEGLRYKKYQDRIREGPTGDPVLTTAEKKRILRNNIYGVDIDPQAVEVTKLSLLLKVLENETGETLDKQLQLFAERALPDLASNIKCGNSLIEPDFYEGQQISLLDDEVLYKINPFDWQHGFPAVFATGSSGGFDVVIGNPPYILLQDELRDDDQIAYFREKYKAASYKLDTYHLFMERALDLTCERGLVSMITPSNFLTNNYLTPLRRVMLEHSQVDHIVVIEGGVFPGVSVDNAVWVVEKGFPTEKPFVIRHVRLQENRLEDVRTGNVAVDPDDEHLLFTGSGGEQLASLWKELRQTCQTLGDVAHVNFGKQLRSSKKFPEDVMECESLESIPEDYRPCYTGSDIGRYDLTWNGLACLDDEVARSGGTWNPERQNVKNKLLCRQVGKYPFFALDPEGYQVLNRAFMVNVKHDVTFSPELLLGILNSRLMQGLWLHKFYDQRGTFPKIKGTYLKKLPVPHLDSDDAEQQTLIGRVSDTVRSLRNLKQRQRQAKTEHQRKVLSRQLEAIDEEVDKAVIALYGLDEGLRQKLLSDLSNLLN